MTCQHLAKPAPAFQRLEWRPLEPEDQIGRSARFLETMRTRRSVRRFSSRPAPRAAIENAVRAAGLAPCGANQQPWTFVVVSDAEVKRRIREAAEAEERESYAHRMTPEWLEALAPLGTDWRKPHLEEAPWLIVVFEQVSGRERDADGRAHTVRHYYPKESVGIAVGFLLAALHHAGLATLVHTPSPMGFLREILERPANERPFAVIPTGHPAEEATVPVIRKKPLEEILVRVP